MYIEYRSIADLNNLIIKKLNIFPHNIDLVVGIPRSGMLPANLIALYLNKPFTDLDSFVEGRIYSSGDRGAFIDSNIYNHILVVDDSINSGHALSLAKEKLKSVKDNYMIEYVAIFASSYGTRLVDYYCEIIDSNRVFQWNIFHHKGFIPYSCFDIDGVLCVNPPIDDDGPKYKEYIANAIPLYIPTVEIDTLVTCRLEKYRNITEAWLKKHNVKYKHLVMLPFNSKEERISWGKHGIYKGKVYKESENVLFVESSLSEAIDIAKVSGKPVFCTENFQMIISHYDLKKEIDNARIHTKHLLSRIKKIVKCILGDRKYEKLKGFIRNSQL